MIRSVFIGGQQATFEDDTDRVAMRFDNAQGDVSKAVAEWNGTVWEHDSSESIPLPIRAHWKVNGWYPMRSISEPKSNSITLTPTHVCRILRDNHGEWAIETPRMMVRLRDDLAGEEASSHLRAHHLNVIRQLELAPNLFEVEIDSGQDTLQVAAELTADADIQYAEPQLIRRLEHR